MWYSTCGRKDSGSSASKGTDAVGRLLVGARASERAYVRACACMRERMSVCVCACVSARACVRA
eukprot:1612363-Pleurochrysis_carterae.AAC.1